MAQGPALQLTVVRVSLRRSFPQRLGCPFRMKNPTWIKTEPVYKPCLQRLEQIWSRGSYSFVDQLGIGGKSLTVSHTRDHAAGRPWKALFSMTVMKIVFIKISMHD